MTQTYSEKRNPSALLIDALGFFPSMPASRSRIIHHSQYPHKRNALFPMMFSLQRLSILRIHATLKIKLELFSAVFALILLQSAYSLLDWY